MREVAEAVVVVGGAEEVEVVAGVLLVCSRNNSKTILLRTMVQLQMREAVVHR